MGPTREVANTPKSTPIQQLWPSVTKSGVICLAGVVEAPAYPSMETDKGRFDPPRAGILKLFNSSPCRGRLLKALYPGPLQGPASLSSSTREQGVSPNIFSENHLPKSQTSRGVPLDSSENQVPKPQIARLIPLRFFRKSGPQISNRKGCPPKIFQEIVSPVIVFLVLLYFGGRRHPSIISRRFRLNYTCGVLRSFNRALAGTS